MTVPITAGASELSLSFAASHASSEGRYVYQRKLGRGAFGVVFLAEDQEHGNDVAVKLFSVPAQLERQEHLSPACGQSFPDYAQHEADLLFGNFPVYSHNHLASYGLPRKSPLLAQGLLDNAQHEAESCFGVPAQLKRQHNRSSACRQRSLSVRHPLDGYQREADLLKDLKHDHIVQYVDSFTFKADRLMGFGIVMQYCSGGSLSRYLAINDKPTMPRRLQWCRELADGMAYLHSKGVVHRDLKPDNILINFPPPITFISNFDVTSLKIADFGLAKAVWGMQNASSSTETSLPQYLTTFAGTKAYMAPEVFSGRYTKACDVFSLGVVFIAVIEAVVAPVVAFKSSFKPYGMLLHENPMARSLSASVLLDIGSATRGECQVIDKMLKFDPKKRHDMKTVAATMELLENMDPNVILPAATSKPTSAPTSTPTSAPKSSSSCCV